MDEMEKEIKQVFPTVLESEKSANIKIYYKGYPIQLTARDEKAELKPLLDKMLTIVEYAESIGCNPSWNEETNKVNKNGTTTATTTAPVDVQPIEKCPDHHVAFVHRKGISRKNGQPYDFWPCPTRDCKWNMETAIQAKLDRGQSVVDQTIPF